MVTRHEFLAELHKVLKPKVYLEIGVQSGASLALATGTVQAIGVDPEPSISVGIPPWAQVYSETSDDFFWYTAKTALADPIDLAFIDGMHLWEYALRDFMNIERNSKPNTVVVFDDVLPYNQPIAARRQPPGDWTGDVWKVWEVLTTWRKDLDMVLVDVEPTGAMVVLNLDPNSTRLQANWPQINEQLSNHVEVPEYLISRVGAVSPDWTIGWLKEDRT